MYHRVSTGHNVLHSESLYRYFLVSLETRIHWVAFISQQFLIITANSFNILLLLPEVPEVSLPPWLPAWLLFSPLNCGVYSFIFRKELICLFPAETGFNVVKGMVVKAEDVQHSSRVVLFSDSSHPWPGLVIFSFIIDGMDRKGEGIVISDKSTR